MEKIFITTISMQSQKDLQKVVYHPYGFTLRENMETSFPIIPVIREKSDEEIPIKIVAITLDNGDVNRNYAKFLQELSEIGVEEEKVVRIPIEEAISRKTQVAIITSLLREIPDDSLIYCDITYGLKPTSVINTFMMIYLPLLKPNCTIRGLYYGQFPRRNGEGILEQARLVDLTDYLYLGEILQQLYNMDVSNPEDFFLKLINE